MKYSNYYLFKRLFKQYTKPRLKIILSAAFFMAIYAASKPAQLALISEVYDKLVHSGKFVYDNLLPFKIAALAIVTAISGYFSTVLMSYTGYGVVNTMQKDLFNHIIDSDLELHHKKSAGEFNSRIGNDIGMIRAAVTDVVVVSIKQFLSIAGIVAYLVYKDWRMLGILIVLAALVFYPITRVAKRLRKLARVSQGQNAIITTAMIESFRGIRIVKAYNAERVEKQRYGNLNDINFRNKVKSIRTSNINNPLFSILSGIAFAGVIWYMGTNATQAQQNTIITMMIGITMLLKPMKSMGGLSNTLQNALAAAERFFTMMDTPVKIKDLPNSAELKVSSGEIRFENITFKYANDNPVLENIDLVIPAGKKVALVGHSGSGKSTVINLILRFYDPESGKIFIDGQDISKVTVESLRKNISLVTQDIFLFDDTVAANINYGTAPMLQEQIAEAAKVARANEFIEKLPGGYATKVGELGVRLSGGQKQRISIARAILRNAPILLLDEATSSLDRVAETEFHAALDNLVQGRTTLIVAHRLSTIMNADLIYVIEAGRIVGSGTHTELLENSEIYKNLFNKA